MSYDLADNLLSIARGGLTTSFTYDFWNRPTSITDRTGVATASTFDHRGRLTDLTVDAAAGGLGRGTRWSYDDKARITTVEERMGLDPAAVLTGTTVRRALPHGGVWHEERPEDASTSRSFDALGRLLSEEDPEGNLSCYAVDALGRVVSMTRYAQNGALTECRTWTYNALGRVAEEAQHADQDGDWVLDDSRTTAYTYDAAGRVIQVAGPEVGSTPGDGLRRVEQFAYDTAGRLTDHRVWRDTTGADVARTHYRYDPSGRVFSITDPRKTTFSGTTRPGCARPRCACSSPARPNRPMTARRWLPPPPWGPTTALCMPTTCTVAS